MWNHLAWIMTPESIVRASSAKNPLDFVEKTRFVYAREQEHSDLVTFLKFALSERSRFVVYMSLFFRFFLSLVFVFDRFLPRILILYANYSLLLILFTSLSVLFYIDVYEPFDIIDFIFLCTFLEFTQGSISMGRRKRNVDYAANFRSVEQWHHITSIRRVQRHVHYQCYSSSWTSIWDRNGEKVLRPWEYRFNMSWNEFYYVYRSHIFYMSLVSVWLSIAWMISLVRILTKLGFC